MRLRYEQIENALKKQLSPLYLVTGDEPLQSGEVADAVRFTAKNSGFTSREILSVESDFAWDELKITANSLSIFSDKKILDLRITKAKINAEGASALYNYCQHLPTDTLLLITMPKLDKSALKTKWFQSIDKVGVVIQIWPLDGADLLRWLQRRTQKHGLTITPDGIKLLATKIEGNLLAVSWEIEKLFILYGNSPISAQIVAEAVANNARFDVFKLIDCVLDGHKTLTVTILNSLKTEAVAAPVVLWALTREARMLIKIQAALNQGQNKATVYQAHRLWYKHKQSVDAVLSRIKTQDLYQIMLLGAKVDRQIKGIETGDCWETLLSLCLLFCSPQNNKLT